VTLEEYCTSVETKMKGGLFSVVVLYVINSAGRPIHGYYITKSLDQLTEGTLFIQAGTLYPILKNLTNNGLIEHEMVRSEEGPPKKIYRMTPLGREALDRLLPFMDELFESIGKVRTAPWDDVVSSKGQN
jgi:PadR family transcriptional regulator PadR